MTPYRPLLTACLALLLPVMPATAADTPARNVIIFVADGLRPGSVNAQDAPTLLALRSRGVNFVNSHSLFPTFTTANAASIASGHQPGDTGDFSNTVYTGFPLFQGTRAAQAFGRQAGTVTPFLENDQVLADIDEHFPESNFTGETSLLAAARAAGLRTASIGKLGPVGIQDLAELAAGAGGFAPTRTVVIDDSTGNVDAGGRPSAPPLPADVAAALAAAGLPAATPPRRQPAGTVATPGTREANGSQQQYFADATTRAVLPAFKASGRPFVLLFWSRDPDGTQHNQGDSLNRLEPGINGPTSRAGVADADANLKQILDYVAADPVLAASTDILVTSDHGFATLSRHETDTQGGTADSYATAFTYRGADGQPEVVPGWLPPGFLAIDLAHLLALPLFDPDAQAQPGVYRRVDPSGATPGAAQRPSGGNGVIGGSGQLARVATEARLVVAANGGSDLVYVPDGDRRTVERVAAFLLRQRYTGGVFVHSRHGRIGGTLPLADIGLEGAARMPAPDLVVAFRAFPLDPANPLQTSIQVSDTSYQEGQGMHGGFTRACTFNNMVAVGPDFRHGFEDPLPVSNADIAPTLAHLLHLPITPHGRLSGRVLREALADGGGEQLPAIQPVREISVDPVSGRATVLEGQMLGAQAYFDQACLVDADEEKDPGALRCP